MDSGLQSQLETYLSRLDSLQRQGHEIEKALANDPSNPSAIAAARRWHEECGATIHQLSGGSKAHWLSRSFSEAFLVRSSDGSAAQGAAPAEIVQQLLGVLGRAAGALSQSNHSEIVSASTAQPAPHRFDFVHNPEIRPVLERAYAESRSALEQGDYNLALMTSCGILESIVTDALEHRGLASLVAVGAPARKISDWSFETRLTVAERAGLIRGGCARLPAVARTYRDDTGNATVTERDARVAGQVLHVVMRDLDPGR